MRFSVQINFRFLQNKINIGLFYSDILEDFMTAIFLNHGVYSGTFIADGKGIHMDCLIHTKINHNQNIGLFSP